MAFKLSYKSSVKRDLKGLPKPEVVRILDMIEKQLTKGPDDQSALKGRFAGLYKLRVGDYRVIYAVLRDEVLILRIGHRKDVYYREL